MLRKLSRAVQELRQTFEGAVDPYRPELHYMRGPGPKWQAKCAAAAVPAVSATNEPVQPLRDIAKAAA